MLSSRAAHTKSKRQSSPTTSFRQSRTEFSTLVEDCPYAVEMIGGDRRFKYVNSAHVSLFGWSVAETMRKRFLDIYPLNRRDEVRATAQILRGAGTFRGFCHAWRKNDRAPFPVEVALRLLPSATSSNADSAGYEEDGIAADISEWRSRIHPDDRTEFERRIADHQANRNSLLEIEHRLLHRDGAYRSMLARGVSIRDGKNQPYRMAGSLTDLTARKQSEEESGRRQAELTHVLRLTTMREMASGLAHELNQPLAAISNYLNGCIRRLHNGASPDRAFVAALEDAAHQILRLGDIIRRLRTYVRKESPQRESVRLNDLCRDVFALHLPEARMHDIRLSLYPSSKVVMPKMF